MRASQHSGREGGGKHNDRQFDLSAADNINAAMTKKNSYWRWDQESNPERTFDESERAFYSKRYGAAQSAKNDRYIREGHADRCKTTDDLAVGKQTRPEEIIIQIGNKDEHTSIRLFFQAVNAYLSELMQWSRAHGNHMQLISCAIHLDEATPHAHIRRVWDVESKDGFVLGQAKALRAAGVPLPDESKPEGRYNNRKMVFDASMRQKWLDICEAHGLEIEREPVPNVRHKSKADFVRQQIGAEIDQLTQDKAKANLEAVKAHKAAQKAREEASEAEKAAQSAVSSAQRKKLELQISLGKLQAIEEETRLRVEKAQTAASSLEAQVQQLTQDKAKADLEAAEAHKAAQKAREEASEAEKAAQSAVSSAQRKKLELQISLGKLQATEEETWLRVEKVQTAVSGLEAQVRQLTQDKAKADLKAAEAHKAAQKAREEASEAKNEAENAQKQAWKLQTSIDKLQKAEEEAQIRTEKAQTTADSLEAQVQRLRTEIREKEQRLKSMASVAVDWIKTTVRNLRSDNFAPIQSYKPKLLKEDPGGWRREGHEKGFLIPYDSMERLMGDVNYVLDVRKALSCLEQLKAAVDMDYRVREAESRAEAAQEGFREAQTRLKDTQESLEAAQQELGYYQDLRHRHPDIWRAFEHTVKNAEEEQQTQSQVHRHSR